MADINETIVNRESIHGDYRLNAACAQQFKDLMRVQQNWPKLSADQHESLDLIATKLARILTGDNNEPDHWHDIGGYAGLVEKILLGEYPAKAEKPMPLRPVPIPTGNETDNDDVAETLALARRLSPHTEE